MKKLGAVVVVAALVALVAFLFRREQDPSSGAKDAARAPSSSEHAKLAPPGAIDPSSSPSASKKVVDGEGRGAPASMPADAVAIGTRAVGAPVARRPDPVDPAAAANAKTGVRGRVIDARGSGVEGARVSLRGAKAGGAVMRIVRRSKDGPTQIDAPGETRSRECVTDAQGRFEVTGLDASYRYRVVAESDAFLTAEAPSPALRAEEVVDAGVITVHAAGSIAGIVLGPDRAPVAGARVRLDDAGAGDPLGLLDDDGDDKPAGETRQMRAVFSAKGPGPMMAFPMPTTPPRSTTSGDDGRFVLERVAPGAHQLLARKNGLRAARKGPVQVEEGAQVRDVELALGKPLELAVVVRDLGAKPIAGAKVLAWVGPTSATPVVTDARGEAVLRGLSSSELRLTIEADGYVSLMTEVKVEKEDDRRTFTLRSGATISGRAVDHDGKPVEGAHVWAEPRVRDGAGFSVNSNEATGADGRFRTKGLGPGDWRLRLMKGGLAPATKDVTIAPDATEVDAGDLALAGLSSVEVSVIDPDGKPVEGAEVERDGGGAYVIAVADSGKGAPENPFGASARTDASGKARVDRLEPGRISLRATHAGFCDGVATDVDVPADRAGSATIKLGRGGRIEGLALGADGSPLPSARVSLVSKARGMPNDTRAANDGTFVFEHVAPGTYDVRLADASDQPDWFAIAEGETVRRTVRGRAGAAIAGTVHGTDGAPVAGAQVDFGWIDGFHPGDPEVRFSSARATTDASGKFRLENLARQNDAGITITAASGAKATFRVALPASGALERDFVLGSSGAAGSIVMQVQDESGAPVVADVTLERADDGPLAKRAASTDDRGAATFAGIAAGPWRLSATSAGFARSSSALDVAAGAATSARLVLAKGGSILVKPVGHASGDLFVLASPDPSQPNADRDDVHNGVASAGAPLRIGGLKNGVVYVVEVHAPGGGPSGKAKIRCDGDATSPVDIALAPGG